MMVNNTDTATKNNLSISRLCDGIRKLCHKHKVAEKNIIVAVSGGADSMFLLWVLKAFVEKENGDLSKIFVVHYHHNVRKEAREDELLVRSYAQGMQYISACRTRGKENEAGLRESRYVFLESVAKRLGKKTIICTGHHLDDRIETTLLHLLRGASRTGIQNMKMIQKKEGYTHYRPLLRIQKNTIINCVEELNIPYVVDKTNTDRSISMRNYIRGSIQDTGYKSGNLEGYMGNLGRGFSQLYAALLYVERLAEKSISYTILQPSPLRGHCERYVLIHDISLRGIYTLLSELNYAFGWYTKQVANIASFLENKKVSGHMYVKGVYFFKSHGKYYLIKAQQGFWEKSGNIRDVPWIKKDNRDEYGEIRPPMIGEKIGSKSLKKILLNRKVPIFRRNSIPILQKTPKVSKLLLPQDTSCYW